MERGEGFEYEPGGSIHDYIAFYFGPLSPMLYSISKGNSDYDGTQEEIIYIVTSVSKIEKMDLRFIFTDGHAIMQTSKTYNDLADLDKIDWEIISGKYWHDNPPQYTDRMRKRMAEFLVQSFVPVEAIRGIAVMNEKMKTIVDEIVLENEMTISVVQKPEWYY